MCASSFLNLPLDACSINNKSKVKCLQRNLYPPPTPNAGVTIIRSTGSFTDEENENEVWNNHVDLGLWADLMIIAPATANTLSKMATGNADNFLIATYLSAKCPVYFAPAMDLDMYQHGSTKKSIDTLVGYSNHFIPATSGELASGLVGEPTAPVIGKAGATNINS